MEIHRKSGKGIVVYDLNSQVTAWPECVLTDLESLTLALEAKQPLVIYRPDQDNVDDDFKAFSDILWPLTNYILIIDEAHWLQSPGWAHPCLAKYVRMADPYGVDLIQVAHAPADLWGRARSLASDWYIFLTTRPADLDAIELQCGEEIRLEVSRLGLHDYIHWNADAHTTEIVTDSSLWYVDIKTPRVEVIQ